MLLVFLRIAAIAAVAAAASAQTAAAQAAAAALAPHRALYALSLADADPASGVVSVDGRLAMEIGDSCDGYTANERMVLRIGVIEADPTLFDYRFTAYEAKDASDFRFSNSTRLDGVEVSGSSGRVERDANGARVATFDDEHAEPMVLPADAAFPAEQQLAIIAAARAGESRFSGVLFDGASDDPMSESSAAISAAPGGEVGQPALARVARWRVSVAYFQIGGGEGAPQYEVSFDLYENGVADRMTLVFDDFTLSGRLAELELPPSEC